MSKFLKQSFSKRIRNSALVMNKFRKRGYIRLHSAAAALRSAPFRHSSGIRFITRAGLLDPLTPTIPHYNIHVYELSKKVN